MALLDDVKVALRISTDDAGIEAQLTRLISEAMADLSYTADINSDIIGEASDPLVIGAILCYVKIHWTDDADETAKLEVSYSDYKSKLAMASHYSTYED